MARKQTRLEELIAAWPRLPKHIKATISDIAQANIIYANSLVLWPGRASRLRNNDRGREKDPRTVQDVKQKRCSACKKWKDETQFYRNRRSKDGLKSRCKKCSSKAVKKGT